MFDGSQLTIGNLRDAAYVYLDGEYQVRRWTPIHAASTHSEYFLLIRFVVISEPPPVLNLASHFSEVASQVRNWLAISELFQKRLAKFETSGGMKCLQHSHVRATFNAASTHR